MNLNKIVELVINLEEFEFEDLGVEILSLVDKPAIEVEWMAFSEEVEDDGADLEQFASYSDYPDSVKNNAKRGIELNEAVNNKCATQVGKVLAQQLAKKKLSNA